MYIYPNSTLWILHNVNLNKDYDHTIYFYKGSSSVGDDYNQKLFFLDSSKVKYQLDNQSYMRMERGWLKVNKNQNDLWDCTYLAFRNTSYGNKMFYAFINSVEYINDETSKINFEIDEIQTWFFDYELEKCFVEREHTLTDELFENTVEENLEIGDYYNVQTWAEYDLDPTCVVVLTMADFEDIDDPDNHTLIAPTPRRIGDYFIAIGIHAFRLDRSDELDAFDLFCRRYIGEGHEDSIISMYQVPASLFSSLIVSPGYVEADFSITPNYTYIGNDRYIPKNKKLFCYPYNFIRLINNVGDEAILYHELWESTYRGSFKVVGTGLGVPTVMCYPYHYKDFARCYDEGLVINDFPENAWTGDSWQVWKAKNMEKTKATIIAGVGSTILGGLAVGAGIAKQKEGWITEGGKAFKGGLAQTSEAVCNYVAKKKEISAQPFQSHGHYANSLLNMELGICSFRAIQMHVKDEYLPIIDNYFSKFGYACHQVKVPNRYARTNWTFTKTVGCELTGNIPSDSADAIKAIYDHGITFWANGNNIGNYGDFTNAVLSH